MLTRIAPSLRPLSHSLRRPLYTTPSRFSGTHPQSPTPKQDPSSPPTTQGHATDKSLKKDIQSQYVSEGKENRSDASGTAGENQPIDAARMDGGESKAAEGKGAWKDQVGGQEGGVEGGGKMGGTESAAGEGTGDKIKKALGMKSSRNFSTSARSLSPSETDDLSKARQPKSPDVQGQGDQNPHLKHSSPETPDAGKGNASPEPHLPSKSKQSSSGSAATGEGKKMFSTSARATKGEKAGKAGTYEGEAGKAGYAVPPEALPHKLSSAYSPSEATPLPPAGHTPSSEVEYSSTARDPPNQVLKEKVLKGDMPERNPQPNTKTGEIGLDEAWKTRKP